MKITLPSGVIIDAGEVEIREDGTMILRDGDVKVINPDNKTIPVLVPPPPTEAEPEDLSLLVEGITRVQRDTYHFMAKRGKVQVGVIAEKLGITVGAAGQRMNSLIEVGLVERVGFGMYKAVK